MSRNDENDSLQQRMAVGSELGFFEKSLAVRILIAIAAVIALWLFIHFRDVRLETLELGSNADRFVVAQLDFDFPDDEATLLLRQEALRDIGTIYRIDETVVASRLSSFQRLLSEDSSWRGQLEADTFEAIYRGSEELAQTLGQARFTDPRTLKKMAELGLSVSHFFPFVPNDLGRTENLPTGVWSEIEQQALQESELHPDTVRFIATYFRSAPWNFAIDRSAMQTVRRYVSEMVPPARTRVTAGSRLINRNQPVATRHLAMIEAMNQALLQRRNLLHPQTLLGSLILAFLFAAVTSFYLRQYHRTIYRSNKRLLLLLAVVVLTLILAKGVEYLLIKSRTNLIDSVSFPLLVPIAAILLTSLINARIAAFVSALLTILLALTLAVDRSEFLIANLFASLIAVMSTRTLRQRKEVFIVCIKAWLGTIAVIVAFRLLDHTIVSVGLFTDIVATGVFMLFTGILVIGLVPLLETLFRMVTDLTLTEYMDPTHPLLRRLSIEAPGTYQHSIVVGNLAEAAAISIGANGLFCRVAALYHDIGKLISPQYFVENQPRGWNIHQLLTPSESAQVIMSHVPEGAVIARKAGVPDPFIDIIREHHGTTLVFYFYHAQIELIGGDEANVDQLDFRYPGPKPRSKESTIIMISDTVEAASRSLDEPTEEAIRALVERLVRDKSLDGQFAESRLTFAELEKVKETLIAALVAASHARMAYPIRTETPPAGAGDDPLV